MSIILYTYRTGDSECTPFGVSSPAVAAGLYADENGPGQVFVVVADIIEQYLVSGGEVEHIGSYRAPAGWWHDIRCWSRGSCSTRQWGYAGQPTMVNVIQRMKDAVMPASFARPNRLDEFPCVVCGDFGRLSSRHEVESAIAVTRHADAEAVLRMAAHVAWGDK